MSEIYGRMESGQIVKLARCGQDDHGAEYIGSFCAVLAVGVFIVFLCFVAGACQG